MFWKCGSIGISKGPDGHFGARMLRTGGVKNEKNASWRFQRMCWRAMCTDKKEIAQTWMGQVSKTYILLLHFGMDMYKREEGFDDFF